MQKVASAVDARPECPVEKSSAQTPGSQPRDVADPAHVQGPFRRQLSPTRRSPPVQKSAPFSAASLSIMVVAFYRPSCEPARTSVPVFLRPRTTNCLEL